MTDPSVRPTLPALAGLPLRCMPQRLHGTLLAAVLNRLFSQEREAGELDFMAGRAIALRVSDLGVEARIGFGPGGFYAIPAGHAPDLSMGGTLYDFLLLATRGEDPDTLFFQRRLRLEGDTELGLYLKNLLDALDWDPEDLPLPARQFVRHGAGVYARLINRLPGIGPLLRPLQG